MRCSILPCLGLTLLALCPLRAETTDLSSKQVPAWAADAVWYQIFPDRFRNGDPRNDPTRASLEIPVAAGADWRISSWTADWYARDHWETALGPDFYKHGVFERRYGGDLQGVLDKLDYLKTLGVNALYFNPLFYARSLHKYDGSSYHHIDPFFGPDPQGDLAEIDKETSNPSTWRWTAADKLFLKVIKEAHARGMRVIIDGVFNHTGRDFFAFRNLIEKQQDSPYKDWYQVITFDNPATKRNEFDYKGWWGHRSLPVFAATKDGHNMAAGPKEYIFNATRRWMDPDGNGNTASGVDGWRLDAADERPLEFWADWNALVRRINPQAYTSAEVWKDPQAWVTTGGFSATMNYYGFALPVKGWLIDNHLTPSRFARLTGTRRDAIPLPSAYAMQNLIGSHDTDRVASMIVNADRSRYEDADQLDYNSHDDLRSSPDYAIRKPDERERAIQRLVVLMQMTSVGAPMIYYGDETGMWGATDPDDRQPMVWEDMKYDAQSIDPRTGPQPAQPIAFDKAVFGFYQGAIQFRRTHPTLSRGGDTTLTTDDHGDTLAFARRNGTGILVVAFNRSESAQTVTAHLSLPQDAALLARPGVLFSTGITGSAPEVKTAADMLSITLAPLTGAVIGAVP